MKTCLGCFFAFLIAAVVLTGVGIYLLVSNFDKIIARVFTEATGFQARIEQVDFAWTEARLVLGEVTLGNPERFEESDFLEIETLVADLATDAQAQALAFDELTLQIRQLTVVRRASGEWNLGAFFENLSTFVQAQQLAEERGATGPATEARQVRVQIDNITVVDLGPTPAVREELVRGFVFTRENVGDWPRFFAELSEALRRAGVPLPEVPAPQEALPPAA